MKIPRLLLVGNQEFVPELPLLEEKRKMYTSQVIIPLSIAGETRAFMGLIPDPNVNVDSIFFPIYNKTRSKVSKNKVDDKGKPIHVETVEIQKDQATSSTKALITSAIISFPIPLYFSHIFFPYFYAAITQTVLSKKN